MSLVGSIFGSNDKHSSTNTNVFETSQSLLPAKPQHKKKIVHNTKKKEDNNTRKKKKDYTTNKRTREADTTEEEEQTKTEDEQRRTIFVGNLPLDTTRKSLAAIFRDCGAIDSTRLRSVATSAIKVAPSRAGDQGYVKKVYVNTDRIDASMKHNAQGYVVFESEDSIPQALEKNNTSIGPHHILRVDSVSSEKKVEDPSRSVFVGNLPYKSDETTLRQHFCYQCDLQPNDILNVRIVRDKETAQCKGFGYILFRHRDTVSTALQCMQNNRSLYKNKTLRVMVCSSNTIKKKKPRHDKTFVKGGVVKKSSAVGALQKILRHQGKEKRMRGKKSSAQNNNNGGISRRQERETKLKKRHKKLQKRVTKGMGKMKNR